VEKYLAGLRQFFETAVPGEPSTWTFSTLKRDKTGRFADEDLVTLLQDGCEFGAGGRPFEILGPDFYLTLPRCFWSEKYPKGNEGH
jgi:hypothetical protein